MNIPGLDLCATGEDDCGPPFELLSFNGTFKIPKFLMNGMCRNMSDFEKIGFSKDTDTWMLRYCADPKTKDFVHLMKYEDCGGTEDDLENNLVITRREMEILSRIEHRNVLHFYEPAAANTLQDTRVVTESVQYFLDDLITKNVTELYQKPMIKNIMHQLLQGVEYLHRNLITHRNISPVNIAFNKDGFLKLANFRNAKKLGSKDLKLDVMCKNYQAIEVILKAKEHGSAVDIWATGCMFAQLITKKKLFDANSSEASLYQAILNVLGLPNNLIWKDFENLPGVQQFCVQSGHSYNFLEKILKKSNLSTKKVEDLMQDMLIYDPAFRITAAEALEHPYFIDESPVAYPEEKVADLLKLCNIIR